MCFGKHFNSDNEPAKKPNGKPDMLYMETGVDFFSEYS